MRTLTPAAIESINAGETSEVWLAMAFLSHTDWDDPVRLVNNNEDITHLGNTYQRFPFDVMLPNEDSDEEAIIEWAVANSSNELIELFRSVNGPISGSLFWVLASDPDAIVMGPFDLELRGFQYDDMTISGTLVVEPVLGAVYGSMAMNTKNAPGLF